MRAGMLSETARFKISRDVVAKKIRDEIIVLDLAQGEYFGLNETGARLWECIQDGLTVGLIIGRLVEEFEVGEEQLKKDCLKWFDLLEAKKLITVSTS